MNNTEKELLKTIDLNIEEIQSKIEFYEHMIEAFHDIKDMHSIDNIHKKANEYINNISILASLKFKEIIEFEKYKIAKEYEFNKKSKKKTK